jgi:hypothetical protein
MKVIIKLSDKPNKRYTAIFYDTGGRGSRPLSFPTTKNEEVKDKKIKTTHFGYKDKDGFGSTYIDHKNDDKKDAYIARHKVNEDFNDYMSAGSLSRYILWNKKTLRESIADYKRRFSLQ